MTVYDKEFFRKLRADRNKDKADVRASLRPHEVTVPGHEVPPEEVLKFTKKGTVNTQSHTGKIYNLATQNGWEVKLGKSEYFTGDKLQENGKLVPGEDKAWVWVEGVRSESYFLFNENGARLNNSMVSTEELFKALAKEK